MLRKLGIVGLGVPLVAIVAALIFLLFFGTSEPTFDAATRELARNHTVIQLHDEPPAALVVPTEPPASVALVVVLPDDHRHVWSAARAFGLLGRLDQHRIALLIAPGVSEVETLESLVAEVWSYVPVEFDIIAAFDGAPIRELCAEWARVIIVVENETDTSPSCGDAVVLIVPVGDDVGQRMVDIMQALRSER